MSFSSSRSDLDRVVKSIPYFKRLQSKTRARLSTDIGFVGLALRTGCLIDSFAPEKPVEEFTSLLNALRTDESTRELVSSIAHIFEPTAEQSFLVNVALLRERISDILKSDAASTTMFTLVKLFPGSRCELQDDITSALKVTLNKLRHSVDVEWNGKDPIVLPSTVDMSTAVPMAALILDYPVAYIPTTTPTNPSPIFLSGVPVSTYESILTYKSHLTLLSETRRERVSVMKFSCPQSLEKEEKSLSPEVITDALHAMFEERVAKIGDESATFEIVCDTVTFDRLAL